ncbi:unnamed protein product [Bemisia tabaci]|uniref:BTB domain-containing protein n=2 Tax=Bemisia tabaci TaxID=7038 RepID=A0A9P0AIJ2_BEMTA|nr:unnamed protein product [Bemisia tabaci]
MPNTDPKTGSKTGGVVGNNGEDWRKSALLDRLEVALRDNLFTDVCFIVGTEKKRIPAIRSILSLGSSVFATMLSERWSSDGSDIPVPDVEPDAFYELLRFIYCEKVNRRKDVIWSLLYAADKYDVEALKKMCVHFLKISLTPSNVCFYLMKARELGATDLVNFCFEKLSTAATTAIFHCPRNDEFNFCFHDLDIQTICCILERDKLEIEEVDLFKSILGWAKLECRGQNLDTNIKNMRRVLEPALPLIRFRLMSPKEFTEIVSNSGFLSIEEELSILTYLTSKPRPENLRPLPRFQKSIKILIHDERSKETFYVHINCSDTVAELRKNIKDRAGQLYPAYPVLPADDIPGPQYASPYAYTGTPYQPSAATRTGVTTNSDLLLTSTCIFWLKHENVCLENSRPLSDYGIENESIILLQPAQSHHQIPSAPPGTLQNEKKKREKPCNKILKKIRKSKILGDYV